ncbi:MAG: hypothetical protein MJ233_05325 [Mycoplasmoidaceae bacterium]|nr:hypothetical protein [Mycoplasmoidaceae bacterium]
MSYVNFIKQLNKGLFIKRNKKLSEQLTLYFDSATLYDEFLNNKDKILKILRQLDPDPATNIRSTNYANNVGI